jgi:hypothetical protein
LSALVAALGVELQFAEPELTPPAD